MSRDSAVFPDTLLIIGRLYRAQYPGTVPPRVCGLGSDTCMERLPPAEVVCLLRVPFAGGIENPAPPHDEPPVYSGPGGMDREPRMVIINLIQKIPYPLLDVIRDFQTEMKSGVRGSGKRKPNPRQSDNWLDRRSRILMAMVLTITGLCLTVCVKQFPFLPA